MNAPRPSLITRCGVCRDITTACVLRRRVEESITRERFECGCEKPRTWTRVTVSEPQPGRG